jgi:nitrilase
MAKSISVAVVQAAPILFDLEATLAKIEDLLSQCRDADLVLFPEAFVSAYPRGLSFGTVVGSRAEEGRSLWQRYWDSSLTEGDASFERLAQMAAKAKTFLVIGVNEKDSLSGSMYCSLLYFGPNGQFLGKHRKIKPTAQERIIWAEAGGDSLCTFDTKLGKVGGLICWENYMPEARMAMYQKGIELYLAPTADARDNWQHTVKHIALEGRCFVLSSNQFVTKSMYPSDLPGINELVNQPQIMSRGGSVIVDPLGEVLAGPIWDKEEILTAQIDLVRTTQSKLDFDPIGHYARPDIFDFKVKDQPETLKIE